MGFNINQLNAEQREAVVTTEGPVLILAGAGTGKTRTVTCRITNLLDNGVSAESILAVTFTNKAAAEMRERVSEMVTAQAAKEMTICTFHSLCVRLLRHDIDKVGYRNNFSICTASDQNSLIKQLIVKKGGANEKIKPAQLLGEISKAKSAGIPLKDIEDGLVSAVGVSYQKELRARNALDFDDLLIVAEELLEQHASVRQKFRKYFKYVTVDEFQDTNSQQMRLLQHLVGEPYNICVVGDDDQSIYGWRGADVSNILEFEKFFPDPKVIRLEANYRSKAPILELANAAIRHNVTRREKALRPTRMEGELPRLVTMPGDQEEAEFVTEEIKDIHKQEGRPLEDFAILFRTNTQIRKMEEAMRAADIPYRLVGAQSFYDRREIKDLLAYLEILVDGTSDVPLLRILNTPPRGISQNTAILAVDHARLRNYSVWEALLDENFTNDLSTKAAKCIDQFVEMVLEHQERLDEGEAIVDLIESLLVASGYLDWIVKQCKTQKEKDQRHEAISDLKRSVEKVKPSASHLRTYLDKASLDSDDDKDDLEKKPGVTMITLHASKGLEYPVVYLLGLENGILPHKRSIDEGTLDEERRLFYVGVTRAQDELTMTYCAWRTKWGEKTDCEVSPFITELPAEKFNNVDYDELMHTDAPEDELADFLSSMRDIYEEE